MNRQLLTTSHPISEKLQERPYRTVDAICKTHGAYKAKIIEMGIIDSKDLILGCPICIAERQAENEARKAENLAREKRWEFQRLSGISGIPMRFTDRSFENYMAATQGQRIVLGVCRAYAENWKDKSSEGSSLVMTGSPGTGKTHLACAIASSVMRSDLALCEFKTVSAMLRSIKETYRKGSERSEQDAINAFRKPDLLIVDEVGVQVGSEYEKMLMFEVLNERYQSLRPTILISNLSVGELEEFLGHRIMDRYRECGSVLAFDWESNRGRR